MKVDLPGFDYVMSIRHVVAATDKFVRDSLLPDNKNAGVWVVSMSFGGEVNDADQAQLGLQQTSRILYVVAAGNVDGSQKLIDANYVYPKFNGALSNLLVVGALNSKGNLATYTRVSGSNVDLFATGSCICGRNDKPGDNDPQLYGTSQAAPLAATAAAIVADRHPSWNAQQVKWRLISTTDFQDDLYRNGIGGRLNLNAAIKDSSALLRLPLHRTVMETAKSWVSKNQLVEIASVEKSNTGWNVLLNTQMPVLRLHRLKTCVKGYSCFHRIVFEGNPDDVQIEDSAELPYTDKNNTKVTDLHAEDLVDASFTFEQ